MGEDDLIARLFAPMALSAGAHDLKDDVATWTPTNGRLPILTVDAVVEGTHFLPGDPLDTVARKLVRRNVSDIMAKGGMPRACLLSLIWPEDRDLAGMDAFAKGLGEDLPHFGIDLLGGDTTRSRGPLVASLTMIGDCGKTGPVRRSGAKPGDAVYVTGTIGDAGLGLKVAMGGALGLPEADHAALLERYRVPKLPGLEMADMIAMHASAAMDVSDGLLLDADRLGEASGCHLALDLSSMPVSVPVARWLALQPDPAAARIHLAGLGDDYQILFTAPEIAEQTILDAAADGQSLTRIGSVRMGPPENKIPQNLKRGHDPFTKP
jgi:thiamine-monophosphate kinase